MCKNCIVSSRDVFPATKLSMTCVVVSKISISNSILDRIALSRSSRKRRRAFQLISRGRRAKPNHSLTGGGIHAVAGIVWALPLRAILRGIGVADPDSRKTE